MFFLPKKLALLKEENVQERWSELIEGAQGNEKMIFDEIRANVEDVQPPSVKLEEEKVDSTLSGSRNMLVAKNDYLLGYKLYIGAKDYGKQLMVSWYLVLEPVSIWKLALRWIASHRKISIAVLLFGLVIALFTKTLMTAVVFWLFFLGYAAFAVATSRKSVLPQMMGLFDLEELTAYVTTTHRAVLAAVQGVSKTVDFDFAKVDKKSKGFLNIS